jgi:mannitol/fructose-specific phosphotransferase system IIA component (Ntr-type)
MRLRDLLDEAAVKIGLESVDKEECFEEMVDILVRAGRITDRAATLRAIQDREDLATTGIGEGVAVPHGKHASIPELIAAMGTSRDGIEFDSVDGKPVHLVVLLLASNNNPGPHILALAEISRLVRTPGFFRKAVDANTPSELLDILDSEE